MHPGRCDKHGKNTLLKKNIDVPVSLRTSVATGPGTVVAWGRLPLNRAVGNSGRSKTDNRNLFN